MRALELENLEAEKRNFKQISEARTRLIPNSAAVRGLVNLNQLGEIEVNCANETGIPGIFAAGDVTNVPEKQIVVAAGEGAKAALQAHRHLQRL